MARLIFLSIFGLLLSVFVQAQNVNSVIDAKLSVKASVDNTATTPVLDADSFALLQDLPTKNQIPLFDNRFRIDHNVDEITLLLFRHRGSASVVLVRPDGSKLHFNTAKQHDVLWHDTESYDLIKIKQPQAGPWQAIGRLLPESRVMVITEIELLVDPLPQQLMVGETVKVTARLLNGGEPINAKEFRDVLSLEVIFISTNNPELDNFGRGIVQVAQFRDDGKGYDERARDGVFTGEFQLRFAAGEWLPKYIVRTPLYTREIEQAPVLLKPAAVVAEIQTSPAINEALTEELPQPHQVIFNVTDPEINGQSILLQGRIRYPNGEIADFSLNEVGYATRQLEVKNRGQGSYTIEVMAFGTNQDDREFVLSLPEINFIVPPPVVAPVIDSLLEDQHAADESAATVTAFPWLLVILSNIFILIVGVGAIWFVMSDKKGSSLLFWRKKTNSSQTQQTTSNIANNNTAQANTITGGQKSDDIDDILDLTLPDD